MMFAQTGGARPGGWRCIKTVLTSDTESIQQIS